MIASKARAPLHGGRQYMEGNEREDHIDGRENGTVENANQIEYKQKHNRTH